MWFATQWLRPFFHAAAALEKLYTDFGRKVSGKSNTVQLLVLLLVHFAHVFARACV